jgi:predicted transposase YbfD/YdcC
MTPTEKFSRLATNISNIILDIPEGVISVDLRARIIDFHGMICRAWGDHSSCFGRPLWDVQDHLDDAYLMLKNMDQKQAAKRIRALSRLIDSTF